MLFDSQLIIESDNGRGSPSVLLSDYNRSYFIAIKLINVQREDELNSFYIRRLL